MMRARDEELVSGQIKDKTDEVPSAGMKSPPLVAAHRRRRHGRGTCEWNHMRLVGAALVAGAGGALHGARIVCDAMRCARAGCIRADCLHARGLVAFARCAALHGMRCAGRCAASCLHLQARVVPCF